MEKKTTEFDLIGINILFEYSECRARRLPQPSRVPLNKKQANSTRSLPRTSKNSCKLYCSHILLLLTQYFTSYWQLLGYFAKGGLAMCRHFELLLTIDVVLLWRSTEQLANLRAVTSRQSLPRIGLLSLRNSNSLPKWRSSSFCTNNNARSVNRLT